MPALIEFQLSEGVDTSIAINPQHIVSVKQGRRNATEITLITGEKHTIVGEYRATLDALDSSGNGARMASDYWKST
jgi:hypothetical protein